MRQIWLKAAAMWEQMTVNATQDGLIKQTVQVFMAAYYKKLCKSIADMNLARYFSSQQNSSAPKMTIAVVMEIVRMENVTVILDGNRQTVRVCT